MTKWQKVKLGDYLSKVKTGKLDANASCENGAYPFFTCAIDPLKIDTYSYDCECVLVAGNGDLNVKYYQGKFDAYQRTYILESKDKRQLNVKFLYYFMRHYLDNLRLQAFGGIIKYIRLNNIIDAQISLLPKEEQERIAKELDAVSDLLAKQKQLLTEQDTLIKSVFYDMFGDPVTNDKGWTIEKLEKLGTCKNGINFNKEEQGSRCYLLNVGDFQNHSVLDKITYFSEVVLKKMPDDDYFLKSGDIVFVRSNGNKNLVGRCVAIYPQDNKVLYSGFCIRFRIKQDDITTKYLLYYFKDDNIRKLLVGRGANIQNLNQKVLHQLNIPVPPLSLQQKFADIVKQIEAQKQKIKSAITETETLFNALMVKYFDED